MNKLHISKKKLLSLVNENIQEMAMDFQSPDRPERGIQQKLAAGDTPHGKIPYPETGVPNQNFQELLGSERYRQVVAKLREYVPNAQTLNPNGDPRSLGQLIMMMMQAHNNIVNIERNSREQLENLAVELVMKEMGIPEGSLQFDAKIVGMGEIDTDDFRRTEDQQEPEQDDEEGGEEGGEEPEEDDENFEIEQDLFGELQSLDLEKAKRRMINSLIQGASKRGHYMYNYVADRIRQITGSETLINQYGILMSINDTLYWQVSDDFMKAAMGGGGGENLVGGKESINVETDPPTIVARGANFPILVHELIKGVMELFGTRGRNKDAYQEVEAEEDTIEQEIWDLRLGPAIWDRLRAQFPEEILVDENKVELQNYLLTEIFELPSKKFFVFFKEVLTNSERGKRLMNILMDNVNRIFNDVNNQLQQEDFEADLDQATEEVSDEDLMNFLTSLGIKLDKPENTGFRPDQVNQ